MPYLYRHSLGGSRNLRGYDFHEVGPRGTAGDYIGGNTMMHATVEYGVPTPIEMARLAAFYDIGVVNKDAYDFSFSGYNDDVGIGVRLNIPFLGPIRLDYAIPLTTDGITMVVAVPSEYGLYHKLLGEIMKRVLMMLFLAVGLNLVTP